MRLFVDKMISKDSAPNVPAKEKSIVINAESFKNLEFVFK